MTAAGPVVQGAGDHAYFDGSLSGLMESLPADMARSLIHVFDCPSCQDLALADLAESVESRDDEQPPDRPEPDVAALVDELLGTTDGEWSEVLKDPRFHRMDLMDRLMEVRVEQGVCLALLGLVYLEAGEMKRAAFPLFRGLRCLRDRQPCLLSTHGSLALALSLAQIGWEDEAREAREQAWLAQVSPEAAGQAEVSWLEGRTSMALGENGEAHRLLDAARVQLLAGRRFADAALASLDLAALYARTGRRREIGRLAEDLEQAGRQRPEAELGAENLREFVKAGPSSRTAASMAAVLSTSLRRAFRLRFPGLQTLPWS